MMMVENVRQSGLFLAHGGAVHLPPELRPGPEFLRVVRGALVTTLLARASTTRNYVGNERGEDDVNPTSPMLRGSDSDSDSESSETESEKAASRSQGPTVEVRADTEEVAVAGDVLADASIWRRVRAPGEDAGPDAMALFEATGTRGTWQPPQALSMVPVNKTTGIRAFVSVSLLHRPPYCRKIPVNQYYTVKSAAPPVRVAHVQAIVLFRKEYWVIVTFMKPATRPLGGVDSESTGLPILCQAETSSLLRLAEVLEPRHVVHRCDARAGCKTSGPGFENGKHGAVNEFLDNVHFIW